MFVLIHRLLTGCPQLIHIPKVRPDQGKQVQRRPGNLQAAGQFQAPGEFRQNALAGLQFREVMAEHLYPILYHLAVMRTIMAPSISSSIITIGIKSMVSSKWMAGAETQNGASRED